MRYLIAAVALIALVGALAAIKFKQISTLIAFGKQMEKSGPPPEVVGTSFSREQTWGGSIAAVGTIMSVKGVAISNEVPGIVSAIAFESGAKVKQGQVLVTLNSAVERAQLASIETRKELATTNLGRTRVLIAGEAVAPAQLDNDVSAVKAASADLGALRAQIDRKTVRAPFAGRLGIRQVNLGQYVNPGTTLVELESIDTVFVDFSVPQQQLGSVVVGMPVRVTIEGAGGTAVEGAVVAIDPAVDAVARTIKLRASLPNKDERLRPGMFANVALVLPQKGAVVAVPVPAVVRASYGDSVFLVEDKKDEAGKPVTAPDGKPVRVARQQFVRLGESRGDFIAVLDGVAAGLELVSSGAFKLRNGAGVVVNNDVKAEPELAPHPQNR